MADLPTRSAPGGNDILSLLAGLSNVFGSKKETQTTQTKLSPDAMNAMLQQAFEQNSGLAATAQGQRQAGVYNSSTNQLLVNDLVSRLTAQTAMAGAPKTTTTATAPLIDPALALGGTLLMQLMSKKGGGSGLQDTLGNLFSGPGNMAAAGGTSAISSAGDVFQGASLGSAVGPVLSFSDFSGAQLPSLSAESFDFGSGSGILQNKGFLDDAAGVDFGGVEGGTDLGIGSIPWTSAIGANSLEGAIGNVGKSFIGQQFGTALTPILGPLGPILGGILGGSSVICSELYRQNYINRETYDLEHQYASKYISYETYYGYRVWADHVVSWMQKSSFIAHLVSMFAIPYIYHTAHKIDRTHPNSWVGAVISAAGKPLCTLIGNIAMAWEMRDAAN